MREVTIGLLGCGTRWTGLRLGFVAQDRFSHLRVQRILVRDLAKERPGVDRRLLTTDAIAVIDDCDVVVELIGGVHSAGAYVRRALRSGRDVVTANKALLAESGRELFSTAAATGARIGFEASVCGGIPIIRAIERGLAGDSIESITGILNGTCNYILTRMEEGGLDFAAALRMAQERGFAEADPTLDVDRRGCRCKNFQILGELAFGPHHVQVPRAWDRGRQARGGDRAGEIATLRRAPHRQGRAAWLAAWSSEWSAASCRRRIRWRRCAKRTTR